MNNLNLDQAVNTEHISLLENILRQTRNPKIAAVLALDLMLVGVDTVSSFFMFKDMKAFSFPVLENSIFLFDVISYNLFIIYKVIARHENIVAFSFM